MSRERWQCTPCISFMEIGEDRPRLHVQFRSSHGRSVWRKLSELIEEKILAEIAEQGAAKHWTTRKLGLSPM